MTQDIQVSDEIADRNDPFVVLGQQFSTPTGGLFMDLAETIARSHTACRLQTFLTTADGLPQELGDFLQRRSVDLSLAEAWAPVLGHIASLEQSAAPPVEPALQWGLHLATTSGVEASWSVTLPAPRAFVVAGRLEGPSCTWTVRADCDQVVIGLDGDRVLRAPAAGRGDDAAGPGVARTIPLVLAADLPSSYLEGVEASPAMEVSPDMRASVDQALHLVASTGPRLTAWVSSVISQILVLVQEPGRTKSGSRSDFPGLVHASLPESGLVFGENLVHEASHQYYHLARRLQPVDDGSDQTLYYSPAVKRPRPLDRLLLAFHAFGNVALYYDQVAEVDGALADECRRQVARLVRPLEELREPLLGNPALTPMGRALVGPLNDELGAAGILHGAPL